MGYYIECDHHKGKAAQIIAALDALEISQQEAGELVASSEKCAVICVVDNGPFEAAAYCHNPAEFTTFSRADDPRPKTWLLVNDKNRVEELSGYRR